MGTWYKLKIGKFEVRYTPLNQSEDFPYCDINGNELKRVNETLQIETKVSELGKELNVLTMKKDRTAEEEIKLTILQEKNDVFRAIDSMKPFYINTKTGERHETAFKLVNGSPKSEMKKTESTDNFMYCDEEEVNNLVIDKEYLVRGEDLYNDLKDKKKGLKVGLSFGRGLKGYRCILTPSKNYKGFLDMRAGQKYKSEVVEGKVMELEETERLKELLSQVSLENKKIVAKVEDLITL